MNINQITKAAMIDLETLGVEDNAPILQIGSKIFNPNVKDLSGEELNILLDPNVEGRPIDQNTVEWWKKTNAELYNSLIDPTGKETLEKGLWALKAFLEENEVTHIFARSPSFDCRILAHAFKQFGIKMPLTFREWVDCRTVELMKGGDIRNFNYGTHHDALSDCISQIACVQGCLSE